MINRYSNRTIFKNDLEMYKQQFRNKNVNFIRQYETPTFSYPDENNIERLNIIKHIWTLGDRYFKLAYQYYGDSTDWWVIAKFNQLPTESHISVGDIILIPTPLPLAVSLLGG